MNKNRTIIQSFQNAFLGLIKIIKEERNMKIELIAGALAVFLCFYFQVTKAEFLIVFLCCMVVTSLECVNSALEQVVDLASPEYHLLAGRAKDFAAGAVLISAIFAAIIGGIIFLPYFGI